MSKDNEQSAKNDPSILVSASKKTLWLILFLLPVVFYYVLAYSQQSEKFDLVKFIKENGYPVEEHEIITEDGYLLTVYRIPHGINSSESNQRPVLMNHGMMESAAGFLILGPRRGLGFILADSGYDVWLMNARGNLYSSKHVTIEESNKAQFYNFSYHEIGLYDIPACIDYILNQTNQDQLHFLGYSQGTTTFFVMGSLRPEFNKKIRFAVLLSPVMYGTDIAWFFNVLTHYFDSVTTVLHQFNIHDFAYVGKIIRGFFRHCDYSVLQPLCFMLWNNFGGYPDPGQFDYEAMPSVGLVTPSNIAIKQFTHLIQAIRLKRFCQYDYGEKKNLKVYGISQPPLYDVGLIDAPIALYVGKNDHFVGEKTFYRLIKNFKNITHSKLVPYDDWNHLDFLFAKDVVKYLYSDVVQTMDLY